MWILSYLVVLGSLPLLCSNGNSEDFLLSAVLQGRQIFSSLTETKYSHLASHSFPSSYCFSPLVTIFSLKVTVCKR